MFVVDKKLLAKRVKTRNKKLRAFNAKKGSCFVYKKKLSDLNIEFQKRQLENEKLQLDEAEQAVAVQKTRKKKITSLVTFFINILVVAVVLYVQLKQDDVLSFQQLLGFKINYWFLITAFILFAIMMFFKSLRVNLLVKQETKRSRPFLSYKVCAIGRYYDCITPMATGGQPFQIYYLNKRGLPASSAISVPLAKYFISQMSWIFISIVSVIYCLINGSLDNSKVVLVISIICFSLNLVLISSMILLSVSKKIGKILVGKILRLLEKMKLIKNYEKQYNKVVKTVEDYQISMRGFVNNKGQFFLLFFMSLLINLLNYTIPFFIYSALVQFEPSLYIDIIVKTIMIDVAASLIPLPGGTGMSEFSFTAVFSSLFVEGTLFWALLIWRFLSYYIYILQGFGIIVYDYFIGNKKYNWQRKKWELENESIEFKNRQLEKYRKKRKSYRNFG